MTDSAKTTAYVVPAIEIAIKIGVLTLLIGWCFLILKPFISPVIWGVIIAVTVYPLYSRLTTKLGNRRKLAAATMVMVALLIIILPSVKLAGSMLEGAKNLNEELQNGNFKVPLPPAGVGDWPIIGPSVEKVWRDASINLTSTIEQYRPQLRSFGDWLLKNSLKTGAGLLLFALSIIVAGILLASAEGGGQVVRDLFVRLAGERGEEFANDAKITVRNVVKGILGVAIIQALLAGIGFAVAGVPAAGLWAFLCLLLAIIQIGIAPIAIPIIIFMFYKANTLAAAILTIWLVLVMLSDNVLKPILLGRGAPVPMPVIFLGAIGGFISMGFLGLFVGALVLSVGYKLFETWLTAGEEEREAKFEE
jgi:predicted PurR-regulated permease PerM